MDNEIWLPVKDFPNYVISNFGNVIKAPTWDQNGILRKKRTIRPGVRGKTCKHVMIRFQKGAKLYDRRLYRIVAETFVDNPNNYEYIRHIDKNLLNNRADNLEWLEWTELIKHYTLAGEKHGCSKLTNAQVIKIRQLYAEGIKQTQLGEMFGVGHTTIHQIVTRKSWNHL